MAINEQKDGVMRDLLDFLSTSYTAYHAVENAKTLLLNGGFEALSETEDWELQDGGKYFVERGGSSLIAFTVDGLDRFSFKITATHTDSPALKIKENPERKTDGYLTLNVERYGGGILYSFFDRPLKVAGRIVVNEGGILKAQNVASEKFLTIPSVAIHQNRTVNENFAVNAQIDLCPLAGLVENGKNWLSFVSEEEVVSHDLFVVNADMPYTFGLSDEFIASPRIDNLVCTYAALESLLSHDKNGGICVAACFDNEEIGSETFEGAGSDFLQTTLKRIAYALKFDENEYAKALATSFLISADNAHGVHPNHPEKADPTNRSTLGGGVVIKTHADKAYTTEALSSAILKTVFDRAEVKRQSFFNRSDVRSGGTLGRVSLGQLGVLSADIGLAQLAMHSACESFAKCDFNELEKGLTAFYGSDISIKGNQVEIK